LEGIKLEGKHYREMEEREEKEQKLLFGTIYNIRFSVKYRKLCMAVAL
jgi:hypothetical protein